MEMAQACLHQHDADTKTLHKLAAALKSSHQIALIAKRGRVDVFTVEPQGLNYEGNLLVSL